MVVCEQPVDLSTSARAMHQARAFADPSNSSRLSLSFRCPAEDRRLGSRIAAVTTGPYNDRDRPVDARDQILHQIEIQTQLSAALTSCRTASAACGGILARPDGWHRRIPPAVSRRPAARGLRPRGVAASWISPAPTGVRPTGSAGMSATRRLRTDRSTGDPITTTIGRQSSAESRCRRRSAPHRRRQALMGRTVEQRQWQRPWSICSIRSRRAALAQGSTKRKPGRSTSRRWRCREQGAELPTRRRDCPASAPVLSVRR